MWRYIHSKDGYTPWFINMDQVIRITYKEDGETLILYLSDGTKLEVDDVSIDDFLMDSGIIPDDRPKY